VLCAILGAVTLCAATHVAAQDKQTDDLAVQPLGAVTLTTPEMAKIRLRYFGDQISVPDVSDQIGILSQRYRVTRVAVEEFLELHTALGRRTANVPVPGFGLQLQVDSEYVGYALFGRQTQAGQLQFGPYIQNWRSARQTFDGHYGLRLQFPW
jgi:hypothetical protein